jgi:DUF1680 family protein
LFVFTDRVAPRGGSGWRLIRPLPTPAKCAQHAGGHPAGNQFKDLSTGPFSPVPSDDSDAYKVIEGASDALSIMPNPVLEKRLDAVIAQIAATRDRIGFERGPIVDCVEAVNHTFVPEDVMVSPKAKVVAPPQPELLGGVTVLKIDRGDNAEPVTAIPYYAWTNRGLAPMAVWLQRR